MVCSTSILPTKEELQAIFAGMDLPSLPTFPKPFFGNLNAPEIATDHWIQEMMTNAFAAIIGWIVDTIKSLTAIDIPFPNIPTWDFSLKDFIDGNMQKIVDAINVKFPELPPLGGINSPDISVWNMVQNIVVEGLLAMVDQVMQFVQPIVDFVSALHLSIAAPTVPPFPSPSTILAGAEAKLASLSRSINAPDISIPKMIVEISLGYIKLMIQPLVDFVNNLISLLGGTFPQPHVCADPTQGFSVQLS